MSTTTASIPVVSPGDILRRRSRVAHVVVLGLLVALGPFTTDLYLPAFPAVQAAFRTSDVALQLTLSATVAGFALGQLVVGPISDRVGRRVPLLVMTSVHVLSCLAAATASDIWTLAALRLVQGVGAAGGGVVAAAIVRDLFRGHRLVRMLANMALVTGAAPIVAPLVGSQLLHLLDWRGLFVVLAIYGAGGLALAALVIGETRPRNAATHSAHRTARSRYRAVLTDRVFVGAAIVGGMQFAGIFAYLAVSPFLLQETYRLSPQQYGLVFASNSIGLVVASQTASRLMRRIGPQWILVGTVSAQLAAAITLLVLPHGTPLGVVLVPLFVFMTASGCAFPCVQVLALAFHGEEAGTAASLLGVCNFGLGAVTAPLVGLLGSQSASSIGLIAAVGGTCAALSLLLLVRPHSVRPIA